MRNAMMPIGTLIQKHQRQSMCWVKKPPSTGPSTLEMANSPPRGAHVLSALTGGNDVGDDGLREDHQTAAAESLEPAPGDELPEVLRHTGSEGAGDEDRDRDQGDALPVPHLAELAVEGH